MRNWRRGRKNKSNIRNQRYNNLRKIRLQFARSDRDTTYVIDEVTGERREETAADRLAELKSTYDLKTTLIASSQRAMAQIQKVFGGKKLPESPLIIEQKTKKAYMQAISDKNLERLRQRVTGFWDYKLDL